MRVQAGDLVEIFSRISKTCRRTQSSSQTQISKKETRWTWRHAILELQQMLQKHIRPEEPDRYWKPNWRPHAKWSSGSYRGQRWRAADWRPLNQQGPEMRAGPRSYQLTARWLLTSKNRRKRSRQHSFKTSWSSLRCSMKKWLWGPRQTPSLILKKSTLKLPPNKLLFSDSFIACCLFFTSSYFSVYAV